MGKSTAVVKEVKEVEIVVADAPVGRQKKVAPTLTAAQAKKVESLPNTSAKIRYLCSEGYPRADVARSLDIIYQFVRNVMEQKVKTPKA